MGDTIADTSAERKEQRDQHGEWVTRRKPQPATTNVVNDAALNTRNRVSVQRSPTRPALKAGEELFPRMDGEDDKCDAVCRME